MALFKFQKAEKKKKGETNIGKWIYILLLFMPIFAVATACFYVIINKNAYESYSNEYVTQFTKVTNTNWLIEGNQFQVNYNNNSTSTSGTNFTVSDTDAYKFLPEGDERVIDTIAFINESYARINLGFTNGTTYRINNWNEISTTISFTLVSTNYTLATGDVPKGSIYLKTYTKGTLDNVFYYQLDKLQQSDLFNWAKNTGTYTVLHNTTTLLGITNEYTPMLLAYWLIISVMYFIYDIALILIWAVHDKIHDLKDAI